VDVVSLFASLVYNLEWKSSWTASQQCSAWCNDVVVHGCRDLFWLPVEQYRRDGRIVRGFQRGAQSFMTCTAMSTLELTNRVVQTIQVSSQLSTPVCYHFVSTENFWTESDQNDNGNIPDRKRLPVSVPLRGSTAVILPKIFGLIFPYLPPISHFHSNQYCFCENTPRKSSGVLVSLLYF